MPRLAVFAMIAMLLPAAACGGAKALKDQGWSTATGAEAYERLWWKAIQDRDFSTAERHLAPFYTLTTSAGIKDREPAIQYFQTLDLTNISIGELQVKPQGSDMVVSYVASLQSKGSSAPQRFYMITVWQQVKGGWVAIAHSEVPAPQL
jgi:hypothetical protein